MNISHFYVPYTSKVEYVSISSTQGYVSIVNVFSLFVVSQSDNLLSFYLCTSYVCRRISSCIAFITFNCTYTCSKSPYSRGIHIHRQLPTSWGFLF